MNKKYFIITSKKNNIFYIIPDDKEGEQVNFTDKKSINKILSINDESNYNFTNIDNLNYTIQLFSHADYENITEYLNNLINLKNEIINVNELFIFSVRSEINNNYFLTYKNFNSNNEAINYCDQLSFIKKCLIINPNN
tara:strand:- start:1624 stop:2037 length:414 start_codon:yes stop_codon:yes gene_type:complete